MSQNFECGLSFCSAKHALILVPRLQQFAERYLTPTSNTTCSESLFVYPNSDGSSPDYRTIFPNYPRPAFGWGPQTTCIYADSPEITIPSTCSLSTRASLWETPADTSPRELCSWPSSLQLDGRRRDRVLARDGQHQRRCRMRLYAVLSRREPARESAVLLVVQEGFKSARLTASRFHPERWHHHRGQDWSHSFLTSSFLWLVLSLPSPLERAISISRRFLRSVSVSVSRFVGFTGFRAFLQNRDG